METFYEEIKDQVMLIINIMESIYENAIERGVRSDIEGGASSPD